MSDELLLKIEKNIEQSVGGDIKTNLDPTADQKILANMSVTLKAIEKLLTPKDKKIETIYGHSSFVKENDTMDINHVRKVTKKMNRLVKGLDGEDMTKVSHLQKTINSIHTTDKGRLQTIKAFVKDNINNKNILAVLQNSFHGSGYERQIKDSIIDGIHKERSMGNVNLFNNTIKNRIDEIQGDFDQLARMEVRDGNKVRYQHKFDEKNHQSISKQQLPGIDSNSFKVLIKNANNQLMLNKKIQPTLLNKKETPLLLLIAALARDSSRTSALSLRQHLNQLKKMDVSLYEKIRLGSGFV